MLGTPVWAGRPTPVVNGAVEALFGAAGKNAIIFATCGSASDEVLPRLRDELAAKDVGVIGEFSFSTQELRDPRHVEALIAAVTTASAGD